jgi:hypothetical protein
LNKLNKEQGKKGKEVHLKLLKEDKEYRARYCKKISESIKKKYREGWEKSPTTKGKITIYNIESNCIKKINPSELESFLSEGWMKGYGGGREPR